MRCVDTFSVFLSSFSKACLKEEVKGRTDVSPPELPGEYFVNLLLAAPTEVYTQHWGGGGQGDTSGLLTTL